MKESVLFGSLLLALALSIQASQAETMVCPLTEIVAHTNPDEMIGKQATMKIPLNGEELTESEAELGDLTVFGLIYRDSFMDLYNLSLMAKKGKADGHEIRFSILLKYDGPSKGNGFEGPKGTDKYIILSGGGLDPALGIAFLSVEAFKILKPYGISTARLWNTSQEIEAIGRAVREKKLKQGKPIGMNIPLVCWKEK